MKDEITVADDLLFNTIEKLKRLDGANVTDNRERTRRELEIYKGYFGVLAGIVKNPHSDGKTETAREYVGRHIHPGYTAMAGAITLYTNDAVDVPTCERFDLVFPVGELMLLIGTRWNDTNNAALNVLACFDEVQDKMATLDNAQPMTNEAAARFVADIDTLRKTFRQRLTELSAVLMNAPASGAKTLAAPDNSATPEVLGAIADSEERTQMLIHKRFDELKPVQAGIELLVKGKLKRSRDGRKAQAKANGDPDIREARERAAEDMRRAMERVRDDSDVKAGKHGAVLAACRRVCKEFEPLTNKKNALGKFEQYAPLQDWQGNPIKPETLARNIRGSRKVKKAKGKRGAK